MTCYLRWLTSLPNFSFLPKQTIKIEESNPSQENPSSEIKAANQMAPVVVLPTLLTFSLEDTKKNGGQKQAEEGRLSSAGKCSFLSEKMASSLVQ